MWEKPQCFGSTCAVTWRLRICSTISFDSSRNSLPQHAVRVWSFIVIKKMLGVWEKPQHFSSTCAVTWKLRICSYHIIRSFTEFSSSTCSACLVLVLDRLFFKYSTYSYSYSFSCYFLSWIIIFVIDFIFF